jgi:hypothetical protein
MQPMYAIFNCSLPDDSQEIGNRFIQPGFNVASRVQEGMKKRGYPVTEVENHEDFGWSFLVGSIGLFKRKPSVWCLVQVPDKWLLSTEQSREFFIFKNDAYYKRVLDDINAILAADPEFSDLNWLSEEEYTGSKPKLDLPFKLFQFCMALLVIFLATLPQIGFVLAIVIFVSLLANFGSNVVVGDGCFDNHKWPLFVSMIVSSMIVWSLGRCQRKESMPNKNRIEQKTAKEKSVCEQAQDCLVLPMKYFSAIILLIGLVYLIY